MLLLLAFLWNGLIFRLLTHLCPKENGLSPQTGQGWPVICDLLLGHGDPEKMAWTYLLSPARRRCWYDGQSMGPVPVAHRGLSLSSNCCVARSRPHNLRGPGSSQLRVGRRSPSCCDRLQTAGRAKVTRAWPKVMFIWFHCDWFYILAVEQICLSLFYVEKQNSHFLPWNLVLPHCVPAQLCMCLFGVGCVPAPCCPPREELLRGRALVTSEASPSCPSPKQKHRWLSPGGPTWSRSYPTVLPAAQETVSKLRKTWKQGSFSEASSHFQSLCSTRLHHGTPCAMCCPPERAVTRPSQSCPDVGCGATGGRAAFWAEWSPLCLTPQSSRLNHSIEFMYLCDFENQEKGSLLLLFNFFVDNSAPVESVREAWLFPDLMTSTWASLLPLPSPCQGHQPPAPNSAG